MSLNPVIRSARVLKRRAECFDYLRFPGHLPWTRYIESFKQTRLTSDQYDFRCTTSHRKFDQLVVTFNGPQMKNSRIGVWIVICLIRMYKYIVIQINEKYKNAHFTKSLNSGSAPPLLSPESFWWVTVWVTLNSGVDKCSLRAMSKMEEAGGRNRGEKIRITI